MGGGYALNVVLQPVGHKCGATFLTGYVSEDNKGEVIAELIYREPPAKK